MVATTPGAPPLRSRRRVDDGVMTVGRSRGGTIAANTIGVIFSLLMLFPVYWVLNTAFKPADEVLALTPTFLPKHATLANFASAF